MLDLNSNTLIQFKHGLILKFKNNLNGFWDVYHVTNIGASSTKAIQRFFLFVWGKSCDTNLGLMKP